MDSEVGLVSRTYSHCDGYLRNHETSSIFLFGFWLPVSKLDGSGPALG